MSKLKKLLVLTVCGWSLVGIVACTQDTSAIPGVPYERLRNAADEPENWLTYSGTYDGRRFSGLTEIDHQTVRGLQLKWVYPMETPEPVETTPLVVDGVMFLTVPPNTVVALNATTGEPLWKFEWTPTWVPASLCCGQVNRGLAILDDTLYMATIDARLVAIDTKSGTKLWDVEVGDPSIGQTMSAAPLVVKDMVVVGPVISLTHFPDAEGAGPEARGRIDAYDARTGALRWRFHTVPDPGQPGHETWAGDSWRRGGASAWLTGSFDPELNLLYWGVGNPSPPFDGRERAGDNLYSSSVVALDVDTGQPRWHFQFTPHDEHDWDAAQIFVLSDMTIGGSTRRVLLTGNRNGFFYVLDRATGEFLSAKPYARQSWAKGFDDKGRPHLQAGITPTETGTVVSPNADGATSWWSPSFSDRTGLFYLMAHDGTETFFRNFSLGQPRLREPVSSAIRAIDPETGSVRWEFPMPGVATAGVLTTAGDLLFTATRNGDVFGVNAVDGGLLWQDRVNGWSHAAPISYASGGSQFVTVSTNRGLYTFSLANSNQMASPRFEWLQLVNASRATAAHRQEGSLPVVRIAIEDAPEVVAWHIQWNVERFSVRAGQRYAVRFRARADAPRTMRVGFSQALEPRDGLGLYSEVALTSDWQNFTLDVVPRTDEPAARINFDMGGNASSIELSNVDLVEY